MHADFTASSGISSQTAPSPQLSLQPKPVAGPRSISELWDEAYDELYVKEKNLISKYEEQLSISGLGGAQKRQQMKIPVDQKIKHIEDGTWKLKLKDHEFAVKGAWLGAVEHASPVVTTILVHSHENVPCSFGTISPRHECFLTGYLTWDGT